MVPTRLGLAASDRLGRHLSDRWSAVASHALAADLGRIGGRFVSDPSKMHTLLLELHAHEQKWCWCFTITITIYYRPLASRTDIGLQHPSTTFLSRGRLLKHTRTPHLTQNTDPRNAHVGTKTQQSTLRPSKRPRRTPHNGPAESTPTHDAQNTRQSVHASSPSGPRTGQSTSPLWSQAGSEPRASRQHPRMRPTRETRGLPSYLPPTAPLSKLPLQVAGAGAEQTIEAPSPPPDP